MAIFLLMAVPMSPLTGMGRYDYNLLDTESDAVTLTVTFEDSSIPTWIAPERLSGSRPCRTPS